MTLLRIIYLEKCRHQWQDCNGSAVEIVGCCVYVPRHVSIVRGVRVHLGIYTAELWLNSIELWLNSIELWLNSIELWFCMIKLSLHWIEIIS